MANSCSHWWHAPIYFVMSAILAVMAITTTMNSRYHSSSHPLSDLSIKHDLSQKASRALRSQGFNVIATLLQISPELFLSSPESTIFAIQDPSISNLSVPPWAMKQLIQFHTVPSNIPFQRLLEAPAGTCLPTLVSGKKITITKSGATQMALEINDVLISHPDVFLEGPISIHGVIGPFAEIVFRGIDQDSEDILRAPNCNANSNLFSCSGEPKNRIEWTQIVNLLSSNGFVSFAMGLHSVLDGILRDYADLSFVTIFAPRDLPCVASPSPFLDRVVRFHIHPRRLSYTQLASLPNNSQLKTLVPTEILNVTVEGYGTPIVVINGAEVTAPDIFFSKNFRIHGISRALESKELPCKSIWPFLH